MCCHFACLWTEYSYYAYWPQSVQEQALWCQFLVRVVIPAGVTLLPLQVQPHTLVARDGIGVIRVEMKRKAQALNEASEDEAANESDAQTSETSSGTGTDGSELEGSDSDSGSDGKSEVDVDFEFFDPQEVDFHGLKALLQTYLDGGTFSCSELVDTIIRQVPCSVRVWAWH